MPTEWHPRLRLALGFLAFLVLAGAFYQRAAYNLARIDYRNSNFVFFWLAGRMVLSGENPYDASQWHAQLQLNQVTWRPDRNFLYPLPLAVFLAPLGTMPLDVAYVAWQLASEILIALSVWYLLSLRPGPRQRPIFVPLVVLLLFFGPVYLSLQIGALGAFTLAAMVAALGALDHERRILAGILLSLTLLKPPQALPILVLAALWLVARREWKAIAGIGLGGVLLFVLGMLVDPVWLPKFAAVGQALVDRSLGVQSNFFGMAHQACAGDTGCMWLYGGIASIALLGLTGAYLWWHRADLTNWEAFNLIIPTAFLATVYLWSYDQILYVIPVVWIVVCLVDRGPSYLGAFAFVFVLVVVSVMALLILARTRNDLASLITTVAVLGGSAALRSPARARGPKSSTP